MSELWLDSASNALGPDYRYDGVWGIRLAIKLLLAYLILAALCWIELRFRRQAVEVEAQVEVVGNGPSRRGQTPGVLVRYHFRDPVTGNSRMNTEVVNRERVPSLPTAIVEYIPGEYPQSRLKSEARPEIPSVFFWVNVAFFAAAAGLIGYIAWEARHPFGGKKRRRIPYHPDPSRKPWKIA